MNWEEAAQAAFVAMPLRDGERFDAKMLQREGLAPIYQRIYQG